MSYNYGTPAPTSYYPSYPTTPKTEEHPKYEAPKYEHPKYEAPKFYLPTMPELPKAGHLPTAPSTPDKAHAPYFHPQGHPNIHPAHLYATPEQPGVIHAPHLPSYSAPDIDVPKVHIPEPKHEPSYWPPSIHPGYEAPSHY